LGLKIAFWSVLFGGRKIAYAIGLSMVKGPCDGGVVNTDVEVLSVLPPSNSLLRTDSYVHVLADKLTDSLRIMRT
jgi:hypothetical protein